MSIVVRIGSPAEDLAEPWAALVQRAPGNVFIDPTAVRAAAALSFSRPRTLAAWDRADGAGKLVGLWSLREITLIPFCSLLVAPAFNYAFAGTPVIDPAASEAGMAAFLEAIASDPALPKVLRLKDIDADSPSFATLMRLVEARGWQTLRLATSLRPIATTQTGVKRSGSTRKKLRQDWSRLSAVGTVEITNARDATTVAAAFETFLALEAGSWKGAQGTALLNSARDAAFVRRLIADLAAERKASVALLRLGGRTLAAQVLLYCGRVAFTWKTAFDAEFAKYSPGMLLVDRVSDDLLASGEIEKIDSCSPEKSFMAQLWTGRQPMVDLLVDLSPRRSLTFRFAAFAETARLQLRALRDGLRAQPWAAIARRRAPAAAG